MALWLRLGHGKAKVFNVCPFSTCANEGAVILHWLVGDEHRVNQLCCLCKARHRGSQSWPGLRATPPKQLLMSNSHNETQTRNRSAQGNLGKVSCVRHLAQCSTFTSQCHAENDIPAPDPHQQQMAGADLVFGPDNHCSQTLLLCFCKAEAGWSLAPALGIWRIDQQQPDKYSPAKH